MQGFSFSRSGNANCLVCVVDVSWHTLRVELWGQRWVVACRSAATPGLLWHLSLSLFFPFFHLFFLPWRNCLPLSTSIYSPPRPRLRSPLLLDTCHYLVLSVPSASKMCPFASVSRPVCECLIRETECVSSCTGACVRGCVCGTSGHVSHPVRWETVCKWRL